jgi:hypothetical protein
LVTNITGISVNGEGKVTVTPDLAILTLGVESREATVAEAQTRAAEAMDAVMKTLKDAGIAEKDIQTQRFSIYPVTRWIKDEDREQIIGYRVTNTVTAKIRQMDKLGEIIDAVAGAGGDLTRISNISFTVEDPTPYYTQAREKAVKDAVAKARQLAELAGVTLGKPIYISEGMAYVPRDVDVWYEKAGGAPAPVPYPATPISPGEQEIRLTVSIVFAIQ